MGEVKMKKIETFVREIAKGGLTGTMRVLDERVNFFVSEKKAEIVDIKDAIYSGGDCGGTSATVSRVLIYESNLS